MHGRVKSKRYRIDLVFLKLPSARENRPSVIAHGADAFWAGLFVETVFPASSVFFCFAPLVLLFFELQLVVLAQTLSSSSVNREKCLNWSSWSSCPGPPH